MDCAIAEQAPSERQAPLPPNSLVADPQAPSFALRAELQAIQASRLWRIASRLEAWQRRWLPGWSAAAGSESAASESHFAIAPMNSEAGEIAALRAELTAIYASRCWTLATALRRWQRRLLPAGTRRFRVLRQMLDLARSGGKRDPKASQSSDSPFAQASHPAATNESLPAAVPEATPAWSDDYENWIRAWEPSEAELRSQASAALAYSPKLSIVTVLRDAPPAHFLALVDSLRAQTYANWELCVLACAAPGGCEQASLDDLARRDARIRVQRLPRESTEAAALNAGIAMAEGDFVGPVDANDLVAPFALFEMVRALNDHADADLLYSDEDTLAPGGAPRIEPHFKPAWSPDLLRSCNYLGHLTIVRRSLLRDLGGYREGFAGALDYDLFLRVTEKCRQIVHVPRMLYHARSVTATAAPPAALTTASLDAARRALSEHLSRLELDGAVRPGWVPGTFDVRPSRRETPLVSILIPNHNQPEMLERCLWSLDRTAYDNVEIVIIENNSTNPRTLALYEDYAKRPNVRVVVRNEPFNFAAINNAAARHARGQYLLLLNNDIEVIHPDWLDRMMELAVRPDVGIVGAKLLYGTETVQHGGVILGIGGVAGHSHWHAPRNAPGYRNRLLVTHNLQAVTGGCLLIRKSIFDAAGGLDERFVLAFNDVDLCMQVRARGYQVAWCAYAELYHWESKTRGYEDTPEKQARFAREHALFLEKWSRALTNGDPYYSPHLTLEACDFGRRADRLPRFAADGTVVIPAPNLAARAMRQDHGLSHFETSARPADCAA